MKVAHEICKRVAKLSEDVKPNHGLPDGYLNALFDLLIEILHINEDASRILSLAALINFTERFKEEVKKTLASRRDLFDLLGLFLKKPNLDLARLSWYVKQHIHIVTLCLYIYYDGLL